MDHKQVLSNMQTSMNLGNTGDDSLGGLVIVLALITEFSLARILFAEGDKIDEAVGRGAEVSIDDLVDIDESVAKVLDKVCCIEEHVVDKIKLGIKLRNGFEPA